MAGTALMVPLALAAATLAVCTALEADVKVSVFAVLVALYLPSYVDDAEYTGARRWPAFARFCRTYLKSYEMTLEYEEPVDPSKRYIFCSHPHGLLSAHHAVLMQGSSTPSFHELSPMDTRHHLGASVIFRIPIFREYLLWLGCVNADRRIAEKVLRSGKSLVILVGGIMEQMLSQRGEHAVYVKKRKGHIRLALKYGTPIVPGYNFGETDLFTHSSFLLSLRRLIASKLSVALLVGYGSSRWNPLRAHEGVVLHEVFGKPIVVEKIEHPTPEDVDKVHAQYVAELVRIFDKYKGKYGYPDAELRVV
ncbi:hypothetical protein PybrP1_002387 [[Pythium] brassicae (nom. inval.)]|nr:hypothetical protein PybrP1_002387 [[Pythium] brassicae (nom. inval.)]